MAGFPKAFQSDAFQNDAFQTGDATSSAGRRALFVLMKVGCSVLLMLRLLWQ